jgi:phosphoribosylformylglycinamidine cyclo-ligase
MTKSRETDSYAKAGVDASQEEQALERLLSWTRRLGVREGLGAEQLSVGYFANVLDIGHNQGLAICTDGVGTKLMVAEMMGKFDTVGIDCVAMNVNDIICVGARPLALVDYIAVQRSDPEMLEALGRGLYEGARQAGVSIPGGEIAQLPEMLAAQRPGYGFDLVGTCVGLVPLDRMILGQDLRSGDVLISLDSSGIHSNGLTLARRVLFDRAGYAPHDYVAALGRTVGEELLEPTRIYVRAAMGLLDAGLPVRALVDITGDGVLNLCRVPNDFGCEIDAVPEPPAIFRLIAEKGEVPPEQMYRVFNMGLGFCVIVAAEAAEAASKLLDDLGYPNRWIGRAIPDAKRRVYVKPLGLVGDKSGLLPG